jgi:hypothetical protein
VKTAYLAEYFREVELRRRVLLGLNKGESLHSLARKVSSAVASVRKRGLTDGSQRKLSSAITERTQKTPAAMILMPSDRLGLRESPVAMRRGHGRSALSKFMRFQTIGDNLGRLERDFSIAFWLNKVENRQQSCKTNAVLRLRKKEVILKSKRR